MCGCRVRPIIGPTFLRPIIVAIFIYFIFVDSFFVPWKFISWPGNWQRLQGCSTSSSKCSGTPLAWSFSIGNRVLDFLHQMLVSICLVVLKVSMWVAGRSMWKYIMLSPIIDQRSAAARTLSDTKDFNFISSKRISLQGHWRDYWKSAHYIANHKKKLSHHLSQMVL